MDNRGSEWTKWDLHIHTKGTNKNDQFLSVDMDGFLYKFFKKAIENNIEAIGVTDYFTIDKYLEVCEYVKCIDAKKDIKTGNKCFSDEEIRFIKNIFLFPNIELRLLPSTDRGRLINIHCLFNPDYVSNLEHDFFSSLENEERFKMTKEGLVQYGKKLQDNLNDEQALKHGINNFVITPKTLKDLFDSNPKLKENTIVVVSNSNNDGASGLQKHYDLFENEQGSLDGVRRAIYCMSDAIFSSNKKDIKFFLGKRLEGSEGYNKEKYEEEVKDVIRKVGSFKPCIIGCDAHKEDDLFSRFTWIKAHPTFEGLKQIIYEPEQRVKIQKEEPDFKEGKLVIDEVRFYSDNNLFTGEVIKFNKNLNVIIGGRSSGKSILLYNIAKTLLKDYTLLKEENIENKYDFRIESQNRKANVGYNFEIKTLGGISQKMFRDENENSILPEIKYIPQNYLIKLSDPEINDKGKELYKIIRDLINENKESKIFYDEFIDNVQENDKKLRQLIDDFFDCREKILKFEEELKSKGSKEVLEKNIKDNQVRVEELSKGIGLTDEKIKEYQKYQEELEEINRNISEINSDYKTIQAFNTSFLGQFKKFKEERNQIIVSLNNENIKTEFEAKYKILDTIVSDIEKYNNDTIVKTDEQGVKFWHNPENTFNKLLKEKNESKLKIEEGIKPFLDNEEVKKQIEKLEESIKGDKESLRIIVKLEVDIKAKEEKLEGVKDQIFKLYNENLSEYDKVIENLKRRTEDIEKKDNLKIIGLIKYNYSTLVRDLKNIIHNKNKIFNQNILLEERKKEGFDKESLLTEIEKLFDDILNIEEDDKKQSAFKGKSKKDAVVVLLKDNFLDYWELEYEGDKLGQMSAGKASFVILMLIIGLSESDAPILIDQPEDNLDNRSITKKLVKYLKDKKLERQIILVTHNPNIVVNADAENIIVANQKGQGDIETASPYDFDYINGALEDTMPKDETIKDLLKSMGIREHITEIVEGGKEAFKKREEKYGF